MSRPCMQTMLTYTNTWTHTNIYTRIHVHIHKSYFQSMLNVTALHAHRANIYKYMYTNKHTCTYTCKYTYIVLSMNAQGHGPACPQWFHIYKYTYANNIQVRIHKYKQYTNTHTQMNIHTRIHVNIYIAYFQSMLNGTALHAYNAQCIHLQTNIHK